MNDQQLLQSIGEALYGPQWINALARDIYISERSMRRWAGGSDKIPWGVWHDAFKLLETRFKAINSLKDDVWDRVVITVADEVKVENYDPNTHWYFEVHDPESGRHSRLGCQLFKDLSSLRAEIKRHPGMKFRVKLPHFASADDRYEFEKMNPERF
jgi:hypothetical protein